MSSVKFLKYNLNEIHAASLNDKAELVSNLRATRVYNSLTGWGRLWVWYYKLTKPFYKEDKRAAQLRKCLIHVDVIFERERKNVSENARKYQEYLRLSASSTTVDEKNYHQARRGIKEWKQTTQFLKPNLLQKKKELCQKYLQEGDRSPEFLSGSKLSLSTMHHLIKLEGKMQGPLPLGLVNKMATGQNMDKFELEKLLNWISQFNKVRPLHKFLTEFSKYMVNPDIAALEITCLKNQCGVFKQSDPKHLLWRQKLEAGKRSKKIPINGVFQNITISGQFGKKETEPDEQIFFAIKEHPDKLLMVSSNRALLALKKAWTKDGSWGLKTPTFYYLDPQGKYAVVEKFPLAITHPEWKSTTKICERDKKFVEPMANYVKWLNNQKISVTNLDLRYIMFDSYGTLRTVKIQEKLNYDYFALEKFVLEFSQNNLAVFQYMMKESGLWNSKHGSFFRAVVRETLDNKKPDIPEIGTFRGIFERKDLDSAAELSKSILMLRDKLASELNLDKDVVGKRMAAIYEEIKASRVLWPTFEDIINKELL